MTEAVNCSKASVNNKRQNHSLAENAGGGEADRAATHGVWDMRPAHTLGQLPFFNVTTFLRDGYYHDVDGKENKVIILVVSRTFPKCDSPLLCLAGFLESSVGWTSFSPTEQSALEQKQRSI